MKFPFEFSIEIRDEQMLCDLWHRLNVGAETINEDTEYPHHRWLKHQADKMSTYQAFCELDDILEEHFPELINRGEL